MADPDLAREGRAVCVVSDVYAGLDGVARGEVKYIRVPERRRGALDRGLLGPVIGENHPKTGNVHYLPSRSLGSHASVLVAVLSKGQVRLADPAQAARAATLAESHLDVRLSTEELLKVTTWIDTNCQYYGSYWGKRNLAYKGDPTFRPVPTFEQALSRTPPPGF